MKIWTQKWINLFKNKEFIKSLIVSFIFLAISLYINFRAGNYATEKASLPVTDIVLSNIRVFDVDGFFIWGPIFLFSLITILCLYHPKKIPFILKNIALFTVIRSIFISLTHLGPFPTQIVVDNATNFINKFTFGGDLFFSGHTGIPFLFALIFWQNKQLRYFFLAYSIFMGTIVLLGHYHYSIDVLAAFFITYSIYHISLYLFKKDKVMFDELNTK
ncbi:MAG: phosphatase PAP2-related protein [Candidatus Nomurabacteria bacterium]|nr:phosphatase PAP2-related protein [Candidatus Nomurabacteria bacterium]